MFVLDILLVAVFIYALLLLLRRTRYFLMFLGLFIAFVIYFIARVLNLTMTLQIFHYFAGVALVVFVIIFQSEIRKYLEFLGRISSRQIKPSLINLESGPIYEICQAVVRMSQQKIGALIVFQGRDALDTYLTGGIELDGTITEEILVSIFDPHTPGHDGAILISNNRIQRFSIQLPLSSNRKELGKRGTRHSAALGLSEVSDVLCLIISEEKGSVSIAKNGHLRVLDDLSTLDNEISSFINQKNIIRTDPLLIHLFRHNFWLKALAVSISWIIWLSTVFFSHSSRTGLL